MSQTNTSAFRRVMTRRLLPAVAAAGIGIAGLTACSGSDSGSDKAGADKAATADAKTRNTAADAKPAGAGIKKTASGAEFPTWGTRWVVHSSPDTGSPSVGMINKGAAGADRIVSDFQVNTGKRVCEGNACSSFMAHITAPVNGFLSVIAVDIPQDSLPGVPVQGGPGPQQPGGTRGEALQRAAGWLTANGGAQVPYSQAKNWSDGYRQDCSGYVSMALNLGAPGTNTVGLTNPKYTTPIGVADLSPGDLLIDADGNNNTRHVVMFEKWDNPAHTSYTAFEQRGGHGTDHRSLTYGLNGGEFKPYRPVKYTD